jgi:hypothetical protein
MAFKIDVSMVIFATRENDYENGEDCHYNRLSDVIIYNLRKENICVSIFYLFHYFIKYI